MFTSWSYPGVFSKLLFINYTQLYVHMCCCPCNPVNQIRALKCTQVLWTLDVMHVIKYLTFHSLETWLVITKLGSDNSEVDVNDTYEYWCLVGEWEVLECLWNNPLPKLCFSLKSTPTYLCHSPEYMWLDHYIVVSRPVCGFKSMQWLIFITPLRIWCHQMRPQTACKQANTTQYYLKSQYEEKLLWIAYCRGERADETLLGQAWARPTLAELLCNMSVCIILPCFYLHTFLTEQTTFKPPLNGEWLCM